jgi:hypothetical protein
MGEEVELNASSSEDNDPSYPATGVFDWEINIKGDTVRYSDMRIHHTFDEPGRFNGVLRTSDYAGNSASTFFWILVKDYDLPVANAGLDREILPLMEVEFSGVNSTDNHIIVEYLWTINEKPPVVLYGSTVVHRFNNAGNFTVELRVTDYSGLSSKDELVVWVNASNPIIHVNSPRQGDEVKGTVEIWGSVVSPFDEQALSCRIIKGDLVVKDWITYHIINEFNFTLNISGIRADTYSLEVKADDGITDPSVTSIAITILETEPDNSGDGNWQDESLLAMIIILGVAAIIILLIVASFLKRGHWRNHD